MKIAAPLLTVLTSLTLLTSHAQPVKVSFADVPAPPIAARAYVLYDASSGQTLSSLAAADG